MIELVLPKPCTLGHIDLKYSLHPLCARPPTIHVTLLKQATSKIGYTNTLSSQVDSTVNFGLSNDGKTSTGE